MMNVRALRQFIREESPSRMELGTVVATDTGQIRNVSIRLSGGRVTSRALLTYDGLEVGDKVIVVYIEGLNHIVVIATVLSEYETSSSTMGLLAPPANFTVSGAVRGVMATWDVYPGESLSYIIERAPDSGGDPDTGNVTTALVSRGSMYLYVTTANANHASETWHMRARALRWIGNSNIMYSAWSAWSSAASLVMDGRYRTETELSSVSDSEGASLIGIEDDGDYFDGTDVEAALQELGEGGGSTVTSATAEAEVLVADAALDWQPQSVSNDATVDATGDFTIVGIRSRQVSSVAPADGQVYVWNAGAGQWEPSTISGSGGGVAVATPATTPRWHVDGPLAVADEVDGIWRLMQGFSIQSVVGYLKDTGGAGNTIVDVDKSVNDGTSWSTVFANQGNRPSFAAGGSNVATGSPASPVVLSAGVLLRMNVESMATNARNLDVQIYGESGTAVGDDLTNLGCG